jgi:hypothetical protein
MGVAAISAGASYCAVNWPRGGAYVQMGTSVTAGVAASADITPMVVGDRLGMLGINAGLPGACAGRNKYPQIDCRSLYCLVDAITSGDWTEQNGENEPSAKVNVARLKTANFSKITYLGLEYGCASRKLNSGILVMQPAQDWATKNVPGAIDGARDRCILLQG